MEYTTAHLYVYGNHPEEKKMPCRTECGEEGWCLTHSRWSRVPCSEEAAVIRMLEGWWRWRTEVLFWSFRFTQYMFIDFKERKGRKRKRKGERMRERETSMWERNINWLPPSFIPTRDRTCSPGMCPDWASIPQHFSVQHNTLTNWATWPGPNSFNFF